MLKKFIFKAGWRRVTIYALDLERARVKAIAALDKRAIKGGYEPPVGWGLVQVRA